MQTSLEANGRTKNYVTGFECILFNNTILRLHLLIDVIIVKYFHVPLQNSLCGFDFVPKDDRKVG
jgi:hypothetical protein